MASTNESMEESRRQAALQLGLTPDQLKALEKQAVKPGQEAPDHAPAVPMAKELPSGDTGRYRWRQTASEVEILVPIGDGIKTRDVAWAISETHLTLGIRGQEAISNGRLKFGIKKGAGNLWQIDREKGQRYIIATLEKAKVHETWDAIELDAPGMGDACASQASAPTAQGYGNGAASQAPAPNVTNTPAPNTCMSVAKPAAVPNVANSTTEKPSEATVPKSEGVKQQDSVVADLQAVDKELREVQDQLARLRTREAALQARQTALKGKLCSSGPDSGSRVSPDGVVVWGP